MNEKKCIHLPPNWCDYLDNDADKAICAEIERHLAECKDCRVVVDTLRQTIHLYRTLPQPQLPEGVRERLYKTLDLSSILNP